MIVHHEIIIIELRHHRRQIQLIQLVQAEEEEEDVKDLIQQNMLKIKIKN